MHTRQLLFATFALVCFPVLATAQVTYTDCPGPDYYYDINCEWAGWETYYSDATFTTITGYLEINNCTGYNYHWGVYTSLYIVQHCEICNDCGYIWPAKSRRKARQLPPFQIAYIFPSENVMAEARRALHGEIILRLRHAQPGS